MRAVRVIESPSKLSRLVSALKQGRKRIGFVPTMGSLHEGHLSLVQCARKENDLVIVSIFVNPIQFGPKEDFGRYPRNLKRDLRLLSKEKVDFVFAPSVRSIYPKSFRSHLKAGPLGRVLCGPKRPGHFDGVVTVVKRLFDMVIPDRVYFGQKDYQQALIVRNMIKRLGLNIHMKICPTVREKDGLAMSSRNIYLTPEERVRAGALFTALRLVVHLIRTGTKDPKQIERKLVHLLRPYVTTIDYAKMVDSESLRRKHPLKGQILVAVACFVGKTRLIDNILIRI